MRHPRVAVSAVLAVCVLGAGVSLTGSAIGSVAEPAVRPSLTDAVLPSVELRRDALVLGDAPSTALVVVADEGRPEGVAVAVPWSARGVAADAIVGDSLTWDVVQAAGPGRVTVDADDIAPETDGVASWEFDAPGEYEVTVRASAELVAGGVSTGTETYRVLVENPAQDETPTPAPSAEATPTPTRAAKPEQSTKPKPKPKSTPSPPTTEPELPALRVAPLVGDSMPVADAPKAQPKATKKATASNPVVLDDVHIDIAARVNGGKLAVKVKDGTEPGAPVYREPGTVVLHVKPAARIEIPSNPAYRFLGSAGAPAWVLPQTQASGLLWPGWNTETITAADLKGGVTWKLVGVDGPGEFALFLNNAFGTPSVLFDSGDGSPDSVQIPRGTHAHGNWAFTEQGVYRLTVEMSGTTPGGAAVSDREVISVAVGNVDPNSVTGTGGSAGTEDSDGTGGSDGGAGGNGDGDVEVEPLGGSASGSTGGSGTGLAGALATTGAATLTALTVAVALVTAGALLVIASRRRNALR
jgi:putative ABC transporter-associated repeat protein